MIAGEYTVPEVERIMQEANRRIEMDYTLMGRTFDPDDRLTIGAVRCVLEARAALREGKTEKRYMVP